MLPLLFQGEALAGENVYHALAVVTLALHLAWILWVMLGWLLTRNRPWLRWLHIGSLLYSIVIEVGPWRCPLTVAEQWSQRRAGITPYGGSFLLHYLDVLVYPNVSPTLLGFSAVAVCLCILGVYGLRFRRRRIAGW